MGKELSMNNENSVNISAADSTSPLPVQKDECPALVKKIGKTTYRVTIHFSATSSETMSDKIKRMLKKKQNMSCYYDVVNWGKEHNINVGSDYVIIARYNHTTQNLSNRLSINDVKEVIDQRIANEPHYLEKMEKETEKKKDMKPDDFICSVCHSSICIAQNGNVYPCAGWQDYVLGSIRKTSLSEIWNDSIKVQYLRNLRRKDFSKCIQCPDKEFCTMCMIRNANEDPQGDPLAANEFFCNIAKLNRKMVLDWKCNTTNSQSKC